MMPMGLAVNESDLLLTKADIINLIAQETSKVHAMISKEILRAFQNFSETLFNDIESSFRSMELDIDERFEQKMSKELGTAFD